jgi:PAS domain S-box-containing protein
LLIDDSLAYQEEFAELLAEGEFAASVLECVGTASEGSVTMNRSEHDIYFVDYRLPGDSGIALVERARAAGNDRPIIILTGFDNPAIDQAAERAGANDYLPKGGFSAEMLSRAIRYTLRNAAAVKQAREAESRFRLAQEAADIGTWDLDLRLGTQLWSPRQRAMFGLDPDDRLPLRVDEGRAAIHPDDRAAAEAAIARGIAEVAPFETLFRVVLPDPAAPQAAPVIRWLAGKGMVLPDASGRAARVIGVNVDVTDQQNALADLRASRNSAVADLQVSEKRFQTYFDSAVDWLFHLQVTPHGQFLYEAINPAALAATGITAEAAKGRTPVEILGTEIGGVITQAAQQVCATGAPFSHQPTFETKAGEIILDALYLPLRTSDGRITGVLGSARDITERRRLDESLRQSQKMETLGQLAGGVAHDFNNILQSISGGLELVLDEVAPGTRAHDFLSMGLRAAKRGCDLTHHLLAYARKQLLRPQSIALPALLADLKTMLGRTLGPTIVVRIQVADDLPQVDADPSQLQTALVNLAINAAHAMPKGGVLSISGALAVQDDKPWVAVSVTDTGTGMDEPTLARAVEPFFTTKGSEGTGLGLSMVQGFVAQSGGKLQINSALGQGTTVTFLLPISSAAVNQQAASGRRGRHDGGILLVDDDPDVLVTLGAFLESAGFAVTRAASGDEALAVLCEGTPIAAIVSDFAMPGLNGADMIAQARNTHPHVPAMLISGWAAVIEARFPDAALVTLRKPFQRQALIETLEQLLAAPPANGKGPDGQAVAGQRRMITSSTDSRDSQPSR